MAAREPEERWQRDITWRQFPKQVRAAARTLGEDERARRERGNLTGRNRKAAPEGLESRSLIQGALHLPPSFIHLRIRIQPLSLEPQWGGNSRIAEDQHTQAKEWCFSLLFKNSASLPFAKAEAVLFLRLEFIKASNMINNLYTWIVIQKK